MFARIRALIARRPRRPGWWSGWVDGWWQVIPLGDLIEHTPDDCPCGPTRGLERGVHASSDFYYVAHHSLDGRERSE